MLSAVGSRSDLRAELRRSGKGHGNQAGPVCTAVTVGACLCRTGHRQHSPRMPGPRDRVQRTKPVQAPSKRRWLLSSQSDPLGVAEGRTGASLNPICGIRAGRFDSRGRRTPSSLRAPRRLEGPAPFRFSVAHHVMGRCRCGSPYTDGRSSLEDASWNCVESTTPVREPQSLRSLLPRSTATRLTD
jgi:hypothetical protein